MSRDDGSSRIVSPGPKPLTPRCAAHRQALAEAACTRCGDFVCSLCAPLPESSLCAHCALRGTTQWEERGEEGLFRGYWRTWADAMSSPFRLGEKLTGSGYVVSALSYVLTGAWFGALPLSITLAVLSASGADPFTLGLRSTSALSASASWVLGAVAASTLLVLLVAAWAGSVCLATRALGASVSFALCLRAAAYGASLLALPVLGPLFLPIALSMGALSVYAMLRARVGGAVASAAVCVTSAVWVGLLAALGGLLLSAFRVAP